MYKSFYVMFMFWGQFQLNLHKSGMRNRLNKKCLPFTHTFTKNNLSQRHVNLAADYKIHHCNKYFIELACLVHIGEYWFCSVFLFFW